VLKNIRDQVKTHSDQVNASDLLEELRCDTNQGTAKILRGSIGQELAHLEVAALILHLKGVFNVAQLKRDFGIVELLPVQSSDNVLGFVHATSRCEPARRVRQNEKTEHHKDGEE
jgi:hypothetical protein